jgi:chaperone modulatory protein CbpM
VAGERQAFQPDIDYSFTLAEISRCCGVSAEKILVLVGEGVLNPRGHTERDWRFAGSDLARAMQALRLEQDLGINTAGAALAVELLDEMQQLRSRLQLLESLIFPR